jgi:hypothetical protein
MANEIEAIHKDIEDMKKSLDFIKNILAEDYELSEETKTQLDIARKTPVSEYIDHAEVRKKLLE